MKNVERVRLLNICLLVLVCLVTLLKRMWNFVNLPLAIFTLCAINYDNYFMRYTPRKMTESEK